MSPPSAIVLCTSVPIDPCNSSLLLSSKGCDQFCRRNFWCPDRLPNRVQTCCVALFPKPGDNFSQVCNQRSCHWTMALRFAPNAFWPLVTLCPGYSRNYPVLTSSLSAYEASVAGLLNSSRQYWPARVKALAFPYRSPQQPFPSLQHKVICKLLLTVVYESPVLISCW